MLTYVITGYICVLFLLIFFSDLFLISQISVSAEPSGEPEKLIGIQSCSVDIADPEAYFWKPLPFFFGESEREASERLLKERDRIKNEIVRLERDMSFSRKLLRLITFNSKSESIRTNIERLKRESRQIDRLIMKNAKVRPRRNFDAIFKF